MYLLFLVPFLLEDAIEVLDLVVAGRGRRATGFPVASGWVEIRMITDVLESLGGGAERMQLLERRHHV